MKHLTHAQKACIGIFIPCSLLLLLSTAVAVKTRYADSQLGVFWSVILQICWSAMPITSCFGWIRSNWPTILLDLRTLNWSTLNNSKKLCIAVFIPACLILIVATPIELFYIVANTTPPLVCDHAQAVAWLVLSAVATLIGVHRWNTSNRFLRMTTVVSLLGSCGIAVSTPMSVYGLHPVWSDITLLLCWAIPPVLSTLGWIRMNWPSIQYDLVRATLPSVLNSDEVLFYETMAHSNPRLIWWLVIKKLRSKISNIWSGKGNQN